MLVALKAVGTPHNLDHENWDLHDTYASLDAVVAAMRRDYACTSIELTYPKGQPDTVCLMEVTSPTHRDLFKLVRQHTPASITLQANDREYTVSTSGSGQTSRD